jgi:hypothetical protein
MSRTTTSQYDAKKIAAQNKPVEIVDFFLGSQTVDDADTKHYGMYDKTIDFFDIDGNAQSYSPGRLSRGQVAHNAGLRQSSVTIQFGNVDNRFQTFFWQHPGFLLDKRFLIRQIFADQVDLATHSITILDGIVDHVFIGENVCQIKVVSKTGYTGFRSGVAVDRVCPISVFANARCAQGVTASTLTQETTDTVDAGSTASVVKVKTMAQADDFWNIGKIEFTSGANDGYVRNIIDWVQSTKSFTLAFPLPAAPADGDTMKALRDCNRTLDMCKTRFTEVGANGNMANFRGKNTVARSLNP